LRSKTANLDSVGEKSITLYCRLYTPSMIIDLLLGLAAKSWNNTMRIAVKTTLGLMSNVQQRKVAYGGQKAIDTHNIIYYSWYSAVMQLLYFPRQPG